MCIIYDYMCITTLCKCALNTKLLRISLFVYESMSISVRCIVFVILFCDTVLGCVTQFFYFLYLHIHTKANKLFLLVFIKTNFFCLVSCVYVCICLCCPLCICAYLRVAPCLLFVSVHFFVSVHICALHYFMTLFFDTVLWYCFGVYPSFVIVFVFPFFFLPCSSVRIALVILFVYSFLRDQISCMNYTVFLHVHICVNFYLFVVNVY